MGDTLDILITDITTTCLTTVITTITVITCTTVTSGETGVLSVRLKLIPKPKPILTTTMLDTMETTKLEAMDTMNITNPQPIPATTCITVTSGTPTDSTITRGILQIKWKIVGPNAINPKFKYLIFSNCWLIFSNKPFQS